jgi:hypothetical protein
MAIFYPLSAVLTIFCNILSNPLDSQSVADAELLLALPELIKNIRTPQLHADMIKHITLIDDFIGELIILIGCAVGKARRELLLD